MNDFEKRLKDLQEKLEDCQKRNAGLSAGGIGNHLQIWGITTIKFINEDTMDLPPLEIDGKQVDMKDLKQQLAKNIKSILDGTWQ